METIHIGMAEYKVATNPAKLMSIGLGSCIGVALYDALNKIGGLAHALLPRASDGIDVLRPAKYADTAISLMLARMEEQGSIYRNIKAKIFGGAHMFPNLKSTELMNIGKSNIVAVKHELGKRELEIAAEDTGGNSGRSILFDLRDGSVRVKSITGEEMIY